MTKKYDFTIRKGSTFRRRMRRLSSTKRPINLAGYQFIMQLRATAASSEVQRPMPTLDEVLAELPELTWAA